MLGQVDDLDIGKNTKYGKIVGIVAKTVIGQCPKGNAYMQKSPLKSHLLALHEFFLACFLFFSNV